MNSNAEPSPTENPKLNKLKEKWEAGDFAIDKDSVYGIDEAIESAGKQLVDNLPRQGTGPIGPDTITTKTDTYGVFDWGETEDPFGPPKQDPLPHHKTCRFCESTSRDDYCTACYRMIREAAEWVQHPEKILTGNDLHPCVICGDSMILNTICPECMNALLDL